MRWTRLGLVWAAVAAVGCTMSDGSAPAFEELVAEHEAGSDVEPTDCGVSVLAGGCPEDLDAAAACFVQATGNCQPAKLRRELTTDEGDPIVSVAFVDADCDITRFTDNHANGFKGDYGDCQRSECGGASTQAYDESAGACATIVWEECETTEEWFLDD